MSSNTYTNESFKVLLIDQDRHLHSLFPMLLEDFTFDKRSLVFKSIYTNAEAYDYLAKNTDVAIVLIDWNFLSKGNGLEIIKYIRNMCKNELTRIIVKTDLLSRQDISLMETYDIEAFKEMHEFTVEKLHLVMVSALRVYSDLIKLEASRHDMKRVVKSSEALYHSDNYMTFYKSALTSFESVFKQEIDGFITHKIQDKHVIVVGSGKYKEKEGFYTKEIGIENLEDAECNRDRYIYTNVDFPHHGYVYIDNIGGMSKIEREMLEVYVHHISLIYNTMSLKHEIFDTQREIIMTLGEIIETKSNETAYHVKRVAEFACLFAKYLSMDRKTIEGIRLAAPMHDIGKIGIAEHILKKPGKLSVKEYEIVKTHTTIGWKILAKSERHAFKLASTIALEHHERWDGRGYPHGKKGEEIHIASRITTISDIIDALSHKRTYKKAWSFNKVHGYINKQSGRIVDPQLVKIFNDHMDEFYSIHQKFPDE